MQCYLKDYIKMEMKQKTKENKHVKEAGGIQGSGSNAKR